MLQQLRQLDVDRLQLEDLVALKVFADGMVIEFERLGTKVPEWLGQKASILDQTIELKLADERAKEMSDLRRQLDALTPAAEKRAALTKRLAQLERVGK